MRNADESVFAERIHLGRLARPPACLQRNTPVAQRRVRHGQPGASLRLGFAHNAGDAARAPAHQSAGGGTLDGVTPAGALASRSTGR
jgi:hypothetical protein